MLGDLVAAVVVIFVVVLVLAAATGRVRVQSCCAVADPEKDLRMRGAFANESDEG